MDERTFWASVWALLAFTICTIVVTLGIDSWHSDELYAKLIKEGQDPIALSCAKSSGQSSVAPICSKVKDGR